MADHVDVPYGWRIAFPEYTSLKKRYRQEGARNGTVFGVLVIGEHEQSEALLAPWFMNSDWLTRADALQDCIRVLEREYDKLFDESRRERAERIKAMAANDV